MQQAVSKLKALIKLAAIFNFVFREGNIPYLLYESNTGLMVL